MEEINKIKNISNKYTSKISPLIGFALSNIDVSSIYLQKRIMDTINELGYGNTNAAEILTSEKINESIDFFKRVAYEDEDIAKKKLMELYMDIKNIIPEKVKNKIRKDQDEVIAYLSNNSIILEGAIKRFILTFLITLDVILAAILLIIIKIIFTANTTNEEVSKVKKKYNEIRDYLKKKLSFLPVDNFIIKYIIHVSAYLYIWFTTADVEYLRYLLGKVFLFIVAFFLILVLILLTLGIKWLW